MEAHAPSTDLDAAAKGVFIAFRSDRLGARLVSLMNAMRLAEDLRCDFRCAWNESLGVGQTFNDPTELFDDDFVARHFLPADIWTDTRNAAETLTGHLQQDPTRLHAVLDAGQNVIVGNAFGVITLRGEDKVAVTRRFREQFARIPFSPPVAAAMARVSETLTGHTAYHIRRGDLTDDPKAKHRSWPHKVVPNEFYESHIEGALTNSKDAGAILFSDDQISIDHYKALFPQLKTLPEIVDVSTLTEAQNDLLELFAMSRCPTIIAPERSAFSSTAADLTGAEKRAIVDAMDEKQRRKAHDDLLANLQDRPESYPSNGRMAQALAHIGAWLEGEGRLPEAADLFAARIRDGLGISFVYPAAMRYMHLIDAPHGVIEIARHMVKDPAIYVKDQATAEVLHGYAHLRNGDPARGYRHIINGFWHSSGVASARLVVPLMAESGLLGAHNFLPIHPIHLAMQRRRGPLRLLFEEFGALAGMDGIKIPIGIGSLDLAVWDFAPLMRSISFQALRRQGAIAKAAETLATLDQARADPAEADSLAGLFQGFDGDPDTATETLRRLTNRDDATAMTWHRLSHAQWLARRFRKAALAADKARELAPDWPILRLWGAMIALRLRKPEDALDLLANVHLPGLPSLPYMRAQALAKVGKLPEAIAAIEEAAKLAPLEVEYAMLAAKIYTEAGDLDCGIGHLLRIVDMQRAPGKLYVQLIDLLDAHGRTAAAEAMRTEALARAPSHPAVVAMAEDAELDGPDADDADDTTN